MSPFKSEMEDEEKEDEEKKRTYLVSQIVRLR